VLLCLLTASAGRCCPAAGAEHGSQPLGEKKRVISKSFHRILDTYSRQTFTGEAVACGAMGSGARGGEAAAAAVVS